MDGKAIVETFQPTDTFQQVLLKTGMVNQTFMTTFPKKVYGVEEIQDLTRAWSVGSCIQSLSSLI